MRILIEKKLKIKKGKIGVEHADLIDIKEALMHVSSPLDEAYESIDKSVLIELGLIVGKDARRRREILSRKLRIGHSNGKQLLKKVKCIWLYRSGCKASFRR